LDALEPQGALAAAADDVAVAGMGPRVLYKLLIEAVEHLELGAAPQPQDAGYRDARRQLIRNEEWAQEVQRGAARGGRLLAGRGLPPEHFYLFFFF